MRNKLAQRMSIGRLRARDGTFLLSLKPWASVFAVVQILELIFSYEIPTPLHISILGLRSGEARGSGGRRGGGPRQHSVLFLQGCLNLSKGEINPLCYIYKYINIYTLQRESFIRGLNSWTIQGLDCTVYSINLEISIHYNLSKPQSWPKHLKTWNTSYLF